MDKRSGDCPGRGCEAGFIPGENGNDQGVRDVEGLYRPTVAQGRITSSMQFRVPAAIALIGEWRWEQRAPGKCKCLYVLSMRQKMQVDSASAEAPA
jgi:hypothetical protein